MLAAQHIRNLERFLSRALGEAGAVRVENLARDHGDIRRETYSFDAVYQLSGVSQSRAFVLRRDPLDGFIDTGRTVEYAAYRSVQNRGVPAPRPLALVTDPKVLGSPFFVAERIEARAASPFHPNPFGDRNKEVGREMFTTLGRIAAIDPFGTELANAVVVPEPMQCWAHELDHWARLIDEDPTPQPIAKAAIRRLRANRPPTPPRLTIVHGDFRIGNFLHDDAGELKAVLDWEMAHIGDPIEDLAWALDPIWAQQKKDLAAGLIDKAEAIRLWEEASGDHFHAERFRWWSLFSAVKGVAIWLAAGRLMALGRATDPVLAFSSWYCLSRHNQMLAEQLATAPRGGL